MSNIELYKKNFLFLLNKCILLFKYINIDKQQEILNEIKLYIVKLEKISYTATDKTKMFEILINYFNDLINKKIYFLIEHPNKNSIISEIDKKTDLLVNNSEGLDRNIYSIIPSSIIPNSNEKIMENNEIKLFKEEYLYHLQKTKEDNAEFENKINTKLKDICKDFTISLEECLNYNSSLIEDKINQKTNIILEEFYKNNKLYDKLNNHLRVEINEIYDFVNTLIKENNLDERINELELKNKNDLEIKINKLVTIFNDKIEEIFYKTHNIINQFEKNSFKLQFNKETNDIKLFYIDELITSTNINIKGLIGPKGPEGKKGDSPIFRNVMITPDNRLRFIIQDTNNIYEILSDNFIPEGPPGKEGPKGEKGDVGKSYTDLKLNQENIMRIDKDEENSLILLKSLCIGDKSHCLKDNSISIGGGICYKDNSMSFGNNSKTLDSNSISLFGTCIGKNSFSYRAENVDENRMDIGKKEKNNYNIEGIKLISKEIYIECDKLNIKTNIYENNKLKELEEKINYLEKKLINL